MTTPIFISVVIPTRNRAKLLADTIRSVNSQDYPLEQFEIIVVDDGSTDETRQTVAAFLNGKTPQVYYINQPPSGPNAARNKGLQVAKGLVIIFIDDDVEVARDWLSIYSEALQVYPNDGVYGGPVVPRIEGAAALPHICGACGTLEEIEAFDCGQVDTTVEWVISANLATTRSTVDQIGMFNEGIPVWCGDETEWLIRARRDGLTIRYLPRAKVWHRRPADEVRRMLVKRRFYKNIGGVWYARETGGTLPRPMHVLKRALRYSYHYLRRDCFVGRVKAASELGMLCGLIKWIWQPRLRRIFRLTTNK